MRLNHYYTQQWLLSAPSPPSARPPPPRWPSAAPPCARPPPASAPSSAPPSRLSPPSGAYSGDPIARIPRGVFFPGLSSRTSDRRARVPAHRAPVPPGFDAAASWERIADVIERVLAPGRVSRGARRGGAVARDSRSLGLRACPPVDRAQGATGGGCWRGRTRLIAARRSVIPNISSVPLAPFLRVARAPDRPRRARPPRA